MAEHQARITSLTWRADSAVLASAGDDGKLVLRDTSEGFAARSLSPHDTVKCAGDHLQPQPGEITVLAIPRAIRQHRAP